MDGCSTIDESLLSVERSARRGCLRGAPYDGCFGPLLRLLTEMHWLIAMGNDGVVVVVVIIDDACSIERF